MDWQQELFDPEVRSVLADHLVNGNVAGGWLANCGCGGAANRLAYRWLYLITKAFVDYNGVIVEKYNVCKGAVPHKVDAEYGNQGLDFKGVATEGFGWVNTSYLLGLTFLNLHAKRCLGTLTPPEVFLRNMHPKQRDLFQ